MSFSSITIPNFASVAALFIALFAVAEAGEANPGTEPQNVLDAEAAGQVEVRFIPNDSRSAQVIVANRVDRPLTLRLPAHFAGVPVAAQVMGNANGGAIGNNFGAAQTTGGGTSTPNAQNFGMGGAQGFCWVARSVYGVHDPRWLQFRDWLVWKAPAWLQDVYLRHGEAFAEWLEERPVAQFAVRSLMNVAIHESRKTARSGGFFRVGSQLDPAKPFTVPVGRSLIFRVPQVCLEYGKREPSPSQPYHLRPLEVFSDDPVLAIILGGLGSGQLTQQVTQAAVWHHCCGRTWEQLAAEVIKGAGNDPDIAVFSTTELQAAHQAVEIAKRMGLAGGSTFHKSPSSSSSNAR